MNGKNDPEYLVEWEGYDESQNTWEPVKNLEDCLHLVQKYEEQLKVSEKKQEETKDTEDETTGFDLGWEAENILGATEVHGDMKFLIKWKDKNMEELVSSKIARHCVPQMIIKFYEEHTKWID